MLHVLSLRKGPFERLKGTQLGTYARLGTVCVATDHPGKHQLIGYGAENSEGFLHYIILKVNLAPAPPHL